jgi:hypothetical protein
MNNKQSNKIENVLFVIAIIVASFVIVMGFLALVGKIVMSIFS